MLKPTATTNSNLPFGVHGETLVEALDYAAKGDTGYNFYSVRGELTYCLSHAELREQAVDLARRLVNAGLPQGARFAMIAETTPDFIRHFFACQYAGLVPVPLSLPQIQGGREAYVRRLNRQIGSSGAVAAMASPDLVDFLREGVAGLDLKLVGTPADFYALPLGQADTRPFGRDDLCYLQYSSGSTQFPKGVTVTQKSLASNVFAISMHGLEIRSGDRCASWLPLYHDMGLVGFCLTPAFACLSVDYLSTVDFPRRPLVWLEMISANRGTLAFSPTFGYELCVRRAKNRSSAHLDLDSWRVAGIGGDMIQADVLQKFSECFAEAGFRPTTFVPSYGLAEATLAVSFAPLGQGVRLDTVNTREYPLNVHAFPDRSNGAAKPNGNGAAKPNGNGAAKPNGNGAARANGSNGSNGGNGADAMAGATQPFANCGRVLPGFELEVRDGGGRTVLDRVIGRIFIRGDSIMGGYFDDEAATAQVMSDYGWLDTGDMGYLVDGSVVITGRGKDLIISHGRNIWPQDIEWAVEQLPGMRRGGVAAFSDSGEGGDETLVVVAECRTFDSEVRKDLVREVTMCVARTVGADCEVVLVRPRTLPYTSSGKLSRASAKREFLAGAYAADEATAVAADEPQQASAAGGAAS